MLTTVSVFALATSLTAPVGPIEPTPGTSGTITFHRSNQMVAPELFIFEPSDLVGFDTPAPTGAKEYNRQMHEIEYYWDFGDPGATFDKLVNVLPWQKDANTAKGPVVSKVYQPGGYIVTCFIYEPSSGKNTTLTLIIGGGSANTPAVQDPEVVFAGAATLFVDPDGIYTGAPTGSVGYTSLATALSDSSLTSSLRRVMLRGGKTHTLTGHTIRMDLRSQTQVYLTGEPTGEMAILESLTGGNTIVTQNLPSGNTLDLYIGRIKAIGNWDEETELNPGVVKSFVQFLTGAADSSTGFLPKVHPDYFCINDCEVTGFYNGVTMSSIQAPETIVQKAFGVYDCIFGSWLNICTFILNDTPSTHRGNRMARSPNSMMGQMKFDGNAHGCIRMQFSGPFDMSRNDLMNNTGWFQNTFGYSTQQACARLLQSGFYGPVTNVEGNSAEGGREIITISQQDSGVDAHLQNVVVDGNTLVGSYQTRAAFFLAYGGATFRNNICIIPSTPLFGNDFTPEGLVVCDPPTLPADANGTPQAVLDANLAAPINSYSNTIVSLSPDAKYFFGVAPLLIYAGFPERFTNKSEANNVIHTPNLSTPVNAGPLDTTPIWTPRILGPRGVYEHYTVTIAASVAPGGTLTVPYNSGRVAADYTLNTAGLKSPHKIAVTQGVYEEPTTMEVAFGASEITITNNSATTWTAQTATLILNALPNPAPRLSAYDTPTNTVATYRPLAGSSAFETATTGQVSYRDGLGTIRTTPKSKGWLEPA